MDDFNWIDAFADVNILQVEAVGQVTGRVLSKLYQGMIEAGLSESQATNLVRVMTNELCSAFFQMDRPS